MLKVLLILLLLVKLWLALIIGIFGGMGYLYEAVTGNILLNRRRASNRRAGRMRR